MVVRWRAREGEQEERESSAADFSPPLWLIARRSQSARRRENAQRKLVHFDFLRTAVDSTAYCFRCCSNASAEHQGLSPMTVARSCSALEGVIRDRAHHT